MMLISDLPTGADCRALSRLIETGSVPPIVKATAKPLATGGYIVPNADAEFVDTFESEVVKALHPGETYRRVEGDGFTEFLFFDKAPA